MKKRTGSKLKKTAARGKVIRPQNFFLNEAHTEHVKKSDLRKSGPKKTAAQKRAARLAAIAVFSIYRDKAKEYRWRLKAANGKILADSGEGYAKKFNAVRALGRFRSVVADAKLADA